MPKPKLEQPLQYRTGAATALQSSVFLMGTSTQLLFSDKVKSFDKAFFPWLSFKEKDTLWLQ